MPERRFIKGDLVMAKWPGSALYFEGEVEDFNDIEYLIKFDDPDESELAIKYKDVQFRQLFRASSRGRSPGQPGKSPARSTRSPARTTKSPARTTKSPARTTKSPARGSKSPSRRPGRSPGRPSTKLETKADVSKTSSSLSPGNSSLTSNKGSSNAANTTSTTSTTSSSSITSIFSTIDSRPSINTNSKKSSSIFTNDTTTPLRQSSRIASVEKNDDLSSSTTITRTSSSSSSSSVGRGSVQTASNAVLRVLTDFWGVLIPAISTLPIIAFFTMIPLIMTQSCTKKKCTILEFPDLPTKLESYYDPRAVLLVLSTLSFHLLLSFIPIKSKVLPNGAKVRGNGVLTLLLTCLAIPAAMYLKYNVQLVYTMLRQLLVTHTVLGIVMALLLYLKSHYAPRSQRNPRTVGHFLPDLVEGREIAPRLGSVDLKTFLIRYMLCCTVVFNILLIMRDVQLSKGVYSPVLIMICVLQMIYCLDVLWFEENLYTTWEYTRQGTGLMVTVFYLTMPFYYAVNTRLVLNYRTVMPWYSMVGIGLVFFTGYVLMRASNNQKNAFKTNPSSPHLANLESVPTSAGTRLLVGGWWGVIRHPNYVGDILIQLASALLCGFVHGLPWLVLGLSVLSLLFRVYEVEESCKKKYGLSWSNYTGRVKYRLIPKVF